MIMCLNDFLGKKALILYFANTNTEEHVKKWHTNAKADLLITNDCYREEFTGKH